MILDVFALTPCGDGVFTGPSNGPAGKRAYGGHLAAQAMAAGSPCSAAALASKRCVSCQTYAESASSRAAALAVDGNWR